MHPIDAAYVAHSMVCVCVCMCTGHTNEPCKMADSIEMLFVGRVVTKHRIRWGAD